MSAPEKTSADKSTPAGGELSASAGSRDCSVCEWTQYEDGNWETDCNEMHILNEGDTVQNGYNFCPYCGRPLIQAMKVEENHNEL